QREEPVGLVKVRRQNKLEASAGFTPNSVVVAGSDMETVSPGRQVLINRTSPFPGILPFILKTFQQILETNFLRHLKTGCGVFHVQASPPGRYAEFLCEWN